MNIFLFLLAVFVIAVVYQTFKLKRESGKDFENNLVRAWNQYDTIMTYDKEPFVRDGKPDPVLIKFQERTKKDYEMYKKLIMRYPDIPRHNKARMAIDDNWCLLLQTVFMLSGYQVIDSAGRRNENFTKKKYVSDQTDQKRRNSEIELDEYENFFKNKLKESEGKAPLPL